ncbi:threonylcarbamoyl-AMP synthase [Nocardioidaceae bacterium]|nr:threonylcarbamoyl-AMP synthase [Nocardioidaceae bacterium]
MTASQRFDVSQEDQRAEGVAAASLALQRGELVVLPTDTVYGVAADAFDPEAVAALLEAKGRGREKPPPVLVSTAATLDALAVGVPRWARALVEQLWPGGLTLVCRQQTSLQWDLGDSRQTVAVRMPDHDVATELLARTGPLAVSSANRTGEPAALDADAAEAALGEDAAVVLDAGPSPGAVASTILDATTEQPRLLRAGAADDRVRAILREMGLSLEGGDGPAAPETDTPSANGTTGTTEAAETTETED